MLVVMEQTADEDVRMSGERPRRPMRAPQPPGAAQCVTSRAEAAGGPG